jgi:hypothetical protein
VKEGAAELIFTVDESAGGGFQVKDLKAAVGILHDLCVVR